VETRTYQHALREVREMFGVEQLTERSYDSLRVGSASPAGE
jgi:hypothetical protein